MEQIKIDIVPAGVAPVAHASQFDNGRQIRFNLFNQGTPYTLTGAETVTMVVNGEEENIANTSDNYVIWDVAEEDCEEVGVIGCEIRIVLGLMLIGSKNFFLEVEMDPYNGKNVRIVTVGPADICTFETTLPEPYQSVIVNVLATGGNGTPDNPNPINGYTEANITRCGVNLWDEEWEYISSRVTSKNYIKVIPDTVYFFANTKLYNVDMYDENKNSIGNPTYTSVAGKGYLFTTSNNCYYIKFSVANSYGNTYNNDISINYPSSDTEYHPYTGNTYPIAFGQTVYGGVLDVTRGKLSVTWGKLDLGALNYSYDSTSGSEYFYVGGLDAKPKANASDLNNALSDIYSQVGYDAVNGNNNKFGFNKLGTYLKICNLSYSDATSFKTAMTGHIIAYELATPFDIDLTPEQIEALLGVNNVWHDGNGNTEVKYLELVRS